jgi:hypothetical protein
MNRRSHHPPARLWYVLALAVAVFASCPASSSDAPARRGPNTDPAAKLDGGQSPALSAVERLSLSDRLAAYGNRAGDPVALVQAAKIRKGLAGMTQGRSGSSDEFEALLARAAALAPGNAAVAALIADARSYRSRDIPLVSAGLSVLNKIIAGRAADRADLAFRGETPAVVYVKSSDEANLDLYVYDEYNNLICSDEDSGDEAQCRWRPRWTGTFLVDVRNENDQEVAYVLTANYVEGQAATP